MPRAVLVRRVDRLLLAGGDDPVPRPLRPRRPADEAVEAIREWPLHADLRALEGALRERSAPPPALGDPALASRSPAFAALPSATLEERRRAREILWRTPDPDERALYLALARREVEDRLSTPTERVVSLAREEERFERAALREESAAGHFLAGPSGVLTEYAEEWAGVRKTLRDHHRRLLERLEAEARAVLPTLSALVGPRVAARLLSRAGSLEALARMDGGRLQLLGSRRRPGPGRTPRFGVLYLADRMTEVPADRQGAYARSLAALAAIAARTDLVGSRRSAAELLRRRDRRIADLNRRKRP